MATIWRKTGGPNKASTRLLALTLALVLVAALIMTVWGSLDVATDIILSFESGDPVMNLTMDVGTGQPYLPDTLRAVVKLADIQPTIPPQQNPSFGGEGSTVDSGEPPQDAADQIDTPTDIVSETEALPAEFVFETMAPPAHHDYQTADDDLYTYTNQTGEVSYRVYGTYSGSTPTWFACDEYGDVYGIVEEIPVTWSCTDFDQDTPGVYTFTAAFHGYSYAGPRPFATVDLQGEPPAPAPEESSTPSEEPAPTPSALIKTNGISGKLWLDKNANGVMDAGENGVAGYPVHLYTADDADAALQSTQTEADGTYRFETLKPGSYVVGIFSETIGESDYLLPVVGLTQDNRFELVEIGEDFMAMCVPIEIEEETSAENMNAGVRFTSEMMPFTIHTNVSTFSTLKSIVENTAQSGDTIVISDKIDFTGVITIKNKSLTFISKDASTPMVFTAKNSRHFRIEGDANNNIVLTFDNVILDGGKLGGGIELAAKCSLQLITPEIRNCLAHGTVQTQAGAAINTAAESNLTVTNGKIYSNESTDVLGGGSIYANSSKNITLNGCDLYGNKANTNGGAIYVAGLALELTLNNCTIRGNTAANGGGIYSQMSTIDIIGGKISGNTITGNGGGIYLGYLGLTGSLTLTGGEISGNTITGGGNGGGIYAVSNVKIDMIQGTISGNTAANGGGIYASTGSKLTLDNCTVENNTAKTLSGGGIFAAAATAHVNGGTIVGNTAATVGGGIYVSQSSTLFVDGADISGNTAYSTTANGGGGIYVLQSALTIEPGSTVTNNSATCGGGIYGINNATITINGGEISQNHAIGTATAYTGAGGGIYVTGASLTVKSGRISNNDATAINTNVDQGCGGGIAGFDNSTVKISGGTFDHNVAKNCGGGIYTKQGGLLIEKSCKIQYNNANQGAGVYSSYFSLFQVTGGEISENTATMYGGGIYSNHNAETVISGGKIYKNNANTGGGIYINNGAVDISSGEISGNNVSNSGGGIYATGITGMTVSGGKISSNNAATGAGVYMISSGNCTMNISSGEISDNISTGAAGGIYCYIVKSVNLTGSAKISGNTATGAGGGLYALSVQEINVKDNASISGNTAAIGGGIFATSITNKITVDGGEISQNRVTASSGPGGAGIYVSNPQSPNCTMEVSGGKITGNINVYPTQGGGICAYNLKEIIISGGEISGHTTAGWGGGIFVYAANGSTAITVSNGKITGNETSANGGGIFASNIIGITVSGGEISQNKAASGGGIYTMLVSKITVLGGQIINNNAALSGGGFFADGSDTMMKVTGGEISGNTAVHDGGGILISRLENLTVDPMDPDAVIFANNKAVKAYMINPTDIAMHESNIKTEHFSSLSADYTFEYAYNNYDVRYSNGKQLFVVSFDSQGGDNIPSIVAESGSLLTAPSPDPAPPASNPGYIFGGWYKEAACINTWNFVTDTVTNNITLYAKWLDVVSLTVSNTVSGNYGSTAWPFSYTITFRDANGNIIADGKTVTYTGSVIPGSGATVPASGSWTLSGSAKTFTLGHGQQLTIAGIPANSKVQITQAAAGGYSTSFKDSKDQAPTPGTDTGMRDLPDDGRTFDYKNTDMIVPTGIFTGDLQGPVLLVLAALLLGSGFVVLEKYRGHKESF